MLEDENQADKLEEKSGLSLVDVAYRRAKAAKSVKKALDAGKIVRKPSKKAKRTSERTPSRAEEMKELFRSDMSERKLKKRGAVAGKKKSKFKSKSRYKRR